MDARYKLPCSKHGRAIRRMWPKRNGHSITALCATAKPGSANTPKTWKPRKRRKDCPLARDGNSDAKAHRTPKHFVRNSQELVPFCEASGVRTRPRVALIGSLLPR